MINRFSDHDLDDKIRSSITSNVKFENGSFNESLFNHEHVLFFAILKLNVSVKLIFQSILFQDIC